MSFPFLPRSRVTTTFGFCEEEREERGEEKEEEGWSLEEKEGKRDLWERGGERKEIWAMDGWIRNV